MSADSKLFRKYLNRIFVETGSCLGKSIILARGVGFEKIYSVELSEQLYKFCYDLFKDNIYVTLFLGDSALALNEILKDINEPVTFWLDAHYSGGVTQKGENLSSLLDELKTISKHRIKTHTILIDDVNYFNEFGFTTDQVKNEIKNINEKYIFTEESNNVLVAKI